MVNPTIGATAQVSTTNSTGTQITIGPIQERSVILVGIAWVGTLPHGGDTRITANSGTLKMSSGINNLTFPLFFGGQSNNNTGGAVFCSYDTNRAMEGFPAGTYTLTLLISQSVSDLIIYAIEIQSNQGTNAIGLEDGGGAGLFSSNTTGTTFLPIAGSPFWDNSMQITFASIPITSGTVSASKGTIQASIVDASNTVQLVVAYGINGPRGSANANNVILTWPTSIHFFGFSQCFGFAPPAGPPITPGNQVAVGLTSLVDMNQYAGGGGDGTNGIISNNGACVFLRQQISFALSSLPVNSVIAVFIATTPGSRNQQFVFGGDYSVSNVTDTLGSSFKRVGRFDSGDATPPTTRVEAWIGTIPSGGNDVIVINFFNSAYVSACLVTTAVLVKNSPINIGTAVGAGGTANNSPAIQLPSITTASINLGYIAQLPDDLSGEVVTPASGENALIKTYGGKILGSPTGCATPPGALLENSNSTIGLTAQWSALSAVNTYWAGISIPIDPPSTSPKQQGIIGLSKLSPVIGIDTPRINKGIIAKVGLPG